MVFREVISLTFSLTVAGSAFANLRVRFYYSPGSKPPGQNDKEYDVRQDFQFAHDSHAGMVFWDNLSHIMGADGQTPSEHFRSFYLTLSRVINAAFSEVRLDCLIFLRDLEIAQISAVGLQNSGSNFLHFATCFAVTRARARLGCGRFWSAFSLRPPQSHCYL
jgi:hypothetical protein